MSQARLVPHSMGLMVCARRGTCRMRAEPCILTMLTKKDLLRSMLDFKQDCLCATAGTIFATRRSGSGSSLLL